jgi:hypothetical protein
VGEGIGFAELCHSIPSPSPPFNMRSATEAHNQELVGAPDQGAGSSGPPETESLAVGRPLGSIQHNVPIVRFDEKGQKQDDDVLIMIACTTDRHYAN